MELEISDQLRTTLSNVFTVGEFKESYMNILYLFYQRNNNGALRKKPKLSLLDGKSFDKTYINIGKQLKASDNSVLTKDFINYALKELKSYKGKLSPNKLKLVKEVIFPLEGLSKYIYSYLESSELDIQQENTRNLICFSKALEPHIKCEAVKKIYDLYQSAIKNRNSDEVKTNMGTSAPAYNLNAVKDYIKKVRQSFTKK